MHAKGRRRGELWGSLGADLGVWLAVLECIRRGLLDHLMRDAIRMHSDVQSEAIRDAIHAIRGHQRCNPCDQRPSEVRFEAGCSRTILSTFLSTSTRCEQLRMSSESR